MLCNLSVSQTFWNKMKVTIGADNLFNYIPHTLGSGVTMFNVPATTKTSANPLLANAMSFAGPPPVYTPSFHTYVIRTADGARYFKFQLISWYDANVQIGDEGGKMSFYIDELK